MKMNKALWRNAVATWEYPENRRALVILLVLSSLLIGAVPRLNFAQRRTPSRPNQHKPAPVSKKIIIKVLKIAGGSHLALKNKTLVDEIHLRGVDFVLSTQLESQFRRAGASQELLMAVRDGFHRKGSDVTIVTDPKNKNGKTPGAIQGTPILTDSDADILPYTWSAYFDSASVQESTFRQISDKRKVFVKVTGDVGDQITSKLKECDRVEIVKTAKEAEFALIYHARSEYVVRTKTRSLQDLINAPINAPNPALIINEPTNEPTPNFRGSLELETRGTLIATVRDPTAQTPRVVWRGEDTDELFRSAQEKLIARFISQLKEMDILLPKDYLELGSKRLDAPLSATPNYLIGQNDLQAITAPTPNVWQTTPPRSLVGPSPFPTPNPETVAKLGVHLPPASRPLATPAPVTRPVDALPLYIPQPTPTPYGNQRVFLDPLAVGTEDLFANLSDPSPLEKNPYKPLNTLGQLPEIRGKVKVFVNVTGQAGEKIIARLKEYGRLNSVPSALDAEFALHYFTWPDGSKGGALIVTIRDSTEHVPRILWRGNDYKSSNAFDKLVKSFISELKKLGG